MLKTPKEGMSPSQSANLDAIWGGAGRARPSARRTG